MARDPRFDVLFEPIRIGPVTAKNRFFQVPHCNGMGHAMPQAHAAMREVKAEGGWAVICTEECEIHPSGDVSPFVEARLWDEHDIPALRLMCEKVHAHGALAGIELTHNDSIPSRFAREGAQEPFIDWVKKVTTKPVVGVGRFTSPDTMVSQIRRGILDLIGSARPSIADPYLPKKIEEGRNDDIRECIGCNICVSGDNTVTPIRCTQNPSMGEEWRKGWHPEHITPKKSDARILIVGAGPTGLEAARALGQRGYEVHLTEASTELGGRVSRESRLPGLAEWARVRDWRLGQINTIPNVHVYLGSHLGARDVLEFGAEHVLLATGCHWRRDGFGRSNGFGIKGFEPTAVFTSDDIMNGVIPDGPVVVFDDDYFYYASTIADKLCAEKRAIYYVTPDDTIASWSSNTLDYRHIQARMYGLGVEQIVSSNITEFKGDRVALQHVWSGKTSELSCAAAVTITARLPQDALYQELLAIESQWSAVGIQTVKCAGDALAPGLIAHAVYAGHRYACELDEACADDVPFRRQVHTC